MSFNTTTLPSNASTNSRTQSIRRVPSDNWRSNSTRPSQNGNENGNSDIKSAASYFGPKGVIDENINTSKPYPLANKWTFYHDKGVINATPAEYEENIKSLATVSTVQMFWSVYHNIYKPEALSIRSSLHFMKNGIWPVWEDPHNENGGWWSFRVNKTNTSEVWRELLMLLIGEQFEECVRKDDDINGLTVSSRFNSDIFYIWNKNSDANVDAKMIEKITEVLKNVELQSPYYKAHSEHADFKKRAHHQ